MANWDNKTTDNLFEAILSLRSKGEAKKFFRDLLTEQEIIEFSRRFQTAQMLSENVSYSQIEKETGLSSTTIARIAKWLNRGMGGYRLIIQRLNHHNLSLGKKGLRCCIKITNK